MRRIILNSMVLFLTSPILGLTNTTGAGEVECESVEYHEKDKEDLDNRFARVLAFLEQRKKLKEDNLSEGQLLALYALFKEAKGEALEHKAPLPFQVERYRKHKARLELRKKHGGQAMDAHKAKLEYIETVNSYYKQSF